MAQPNLIDLSKLRPDHFWNLANPQRWYLVEWPRVNAIDIYFELNDDPTFVEFDIMDKYFGLKLI